MSPDPGPLTSAGAQLRGAPTRSRSRVLVVAVGFTFLLALAAPAAARAATPDPVAATITVPSSAGVADPTVLAATEEPLLPAGPGPVDGGTTVERPSGSATPDAEPGPSGVEIAGLVLLGLVSLLLAGVALTTVAWMLHAWRTPQGLADTGFSKQRRDPERSFSLLVPARHEEEVLGDTLDALAVLDHPDYEVIAIVGHDDPGTEAVARAAARRHPGRVRVVVDDSVPKNKPKALNRALEHCRGEVVGVFDAEDEVHPQLLRHIDSRFVETGADVVQGGVQLMNIHTSWWALRNCMEYYFWFRSRLHFHAGARFIPLGGNTVFIRTELIRGAGGWDPECLAEDCEIGVRLSTEGARVVVAYDPEVATREETPGTLTSLYKQRTRWNQGFLQVLRKGEWRKLPTRRQRLMARYLLAMPFLQAFTGLMIPVSLILILTVKVPTAVALLTFLPIAPTLVALVVETAGLGDFGRVYGIRIRVRDYLRLLLGTFPFQVFLAAAAVRSVVREIRGDSSWEKTEHANVHRTGVRADQAQPVPPPLSAVPDLEREAA